MARPTTIDDQAILEAARQVFLELGIKATTAEVARRAGVSEGSLFKRFKTKMGLFVAAMRPHLEEFAWVKILEARVGQEDVPERLYEAGLRALDFFREMLPLRIMLWSNREAAREIDPLQGPSPPPVQIVRRLAAVFEEEMRLGNMRRHDPEVLARTYMGSLMNYVFFDVLLRAGHELPLPPEMFVRGLVNIIWTGAEPR